MSTTIAEHKAQIAWNVSKALEALAVLSEATGKLDELLYAVRYNDDVQAIGSDATENVYHHLGVVWDQLDSLKGAMVELKDEVS